MKKVDVRTTENNILIFKIQRPEKRNAIDYDVMNSLEQVIEQVQNDPSIKAFVITGDGSEAFCSGGDLSIFHKLYTEEESYLMLSKMGHILYKLLTLNRPTIALVNGIAIGGGCELATACDFRIATKGSKMGFVQGKLAITTGWGGGTMLLEKLPHDKALQFLLSTHIYSAQEALANGYIHKLLSDENWLDEGISWVEDLVSQCNGSVLSAYKNISVERLKNANVKDRMLEEIRQCSILWGKAEHHAAVDRFLNKKGN